MDDGKSKRKRFALIQAAVALVLLILGFMAVAWSDVTLAGAYYVWLLIIGLYALADFAAHVTFHDRSAAALKTVPVVVLHWLAVFVAIQLMYYFVAAGRIDNADTGLANGVILALGLFTAGTHGNWRMMVVGAALAIATAGVSALEQYMWFLLLLTTLSGVVLYIGARLTAGRRTANT